MIYTEQGIEEFLMDAIGDVRLRRFRPKADRLSTLYIEYSRVRDWLDTNQDALGRKDYKEYLAVLNGLMQNIRNLEDDLDLFVEKKKEDVIINPLLESLDNHE